MRPPQLKNQFLRATIATALLFAGCSTSAIEQGENYTSKIYENGKNIRMVEMKTLPPENSAFMFRYDKTHWKIEEWDAEKAPNKVALIHLGYEKENCVILPGTTGTGLERGNQVIEGNFLTNNYVGSTLDVYNPAGIHVMNIVGYEIEAKNYIFEVRLPSKSPKTCSQDAQAVISTFTVQS
jgi:hypothetical protein